MLVGVFCTLFEVRVVPISLTSYSHFRKKNFFFEKLNIFNIFRKQYLIFLDAIFLRQDIIMHSPVRLEYMYDTCTTCFLLQRISSTLFELFSKSDKNCDSFVFERFLGHFRGNSMESGLPKESSLLFNL